MSLESLHQPNRWREYYELALLEVDEGRLPERIANARTAILVRAKEILAQPSADERLLLTSALRTLSLLEESVQRRGDAA